MDFNLPLFAGILAAVAHVISGPDHLAAVTPFAIESKKKAWKVGLFWGVGHLLGMLSIGVLFLLFKEFIPVEKISAHSEKFVGVLLIGLSIWIFVQLFRKEKNHAHTHVHAENDSIIHKHSHQHISEANHNHTHTNLKHNNIASLTFGFVHGLAGIAHFLLFLPVLGFTTKFESTQYIIGFGIGTLLAMISYAFVIGNISHASKNSNNHNVNFFKGIRFASGLFAFIIGVYWIFVN
ncbi:MAG: sulfite exporter TauE/SafE family protein [Lutibacter sp.]|uniref:urease accessory protein UreH domain-containing protein n=1 Tax=Lutibacter sp. TaxID=1925666 RepID=UPI00299DB6E0|nr:sulfite exporter TauE/SafE family protein [Lutibacter sp.]MDX1828555.1 sulfite exporter TauE/SafE family protein [Lutibacter sp.]